MIQGETYTVHIGSNLDILPTLPDNSVDSIVTDPPYGLSDNKFVAHTIAKWISGERDFIPDGKGFMGKSWDAFVPPPALWDECLRVLKPGGHLLAFFGSRTQDIGALSIRLAGFEIRDSIAWMYGSGFPKSLDISKAIDKRGGQGATLTKQIGKALKEARESRGISKAEADQMFCDGSTNWTWFEGRPAGQRPPTPETFDRIVAEWKELEPLAALVAEAEREVIGQKTSGIANKEEKDRHTIGASKSVEVNITAPSTPEAQQWEGWGTALKPAFEPIVVARKPLIGTVAENVLTHGTGGLNIDGSRIGTQDNLGRPQGTAPQPMDWGKKTEETFITEGSTLGRWPANVILDPYTAELLDEQSDASRFFYVAKASKRDRNEGLEGLPKSHPVGGADKWTETDRRRGAGVTREPTANIHPTVKPTDLMRYLVKLVTPPGGTVLDPFTGSGSTGKAAILEGFRFIGCELTEDYIPIIKGRLAHAEKTKNEEPEGLF